MNPFDHVTATNPEQALALLAEPGPAAQLIAGGTDLLPLMKEHLAAPARLIDLKPIRALRYIRFEPDGGLRIGALATLADLERDATIASRFPVLRQAVRDAATPQLRNAATVGGNLLQRNRCWYFRDSQVQCWLKGGDTCYARDGRNDHHAILGTDLSPCIAAHPSDLAPALIALDAEVAIDGPDGSRTLSVADFFQPPSADVRLAHRLAPSELIIELRVPAQPEGASGAYLKAMERAAWSFALASAAVQLALRDERVERARLVLGGVAVVPWRAREAEALLEGQRFTPELAARAAERAVAGAAPLADSGYKVPLARELARRALLQAASMSG
jgi:xanthine dehydrogenase YagS FAD-binding subunit